jgi:hypothetical protein
LEAIAGFLAEVSILDVRQLGNLRSKDEELPYHRTVIMLVRLTEPSIVLNQRLWVCVGMKLPLIHQAYILPEHIGGMAIQGRRSKGHVLQRRGRQVDDNEL